MDESWCFLTATEAEAPAPPGTTPSAAPQVKQQSAAVKKLQNDLLKMHLEAPFVPKEPPPDFEFVCDPPSISALDL